MVARMTYLEQGYTVHDGTAAEKEVQLFLAALVCVLRPRLIVETGCYLGYTTLQLGVVAQMVGPECRVVSCDTDPLHVHEARMRCAGWPVEVRECAGADLTELREADLVFSDSVYEAREQEVVLAKPGAIVVVHDTKVCEIEGFDLAGVVLRHGGLLFDTYRGFGMFRKPAAAPPVAPA